MSIQLSRRDFMKCSAVAVLAAASGTLLTGAAVVAVVVSPMKRVFLLPQMVLPLP